MLHVGCGRSPRESVVRAKMAGLADVSAMALMKRLKKPKDWLHALCVGLFREQGIAMACDGGFQVRAFDAAAVKEPGKTGSLWRLHLEKLTRHAVAVSPWGYHLDTAKAAQPVA